MARFVEPRDYRDVLSDADLICLVLAGQEEQYDYADAEKILNYYGIPSVRAGLVVAEREEREVRSYLGDHVVKAQLGVLREFARRHPEEATNFARMFRQGIVMYPDFRFQPKSWALVEFEFLLRILALVDGNIKMQISIPQTFFVSDDSNIPLRQLFREVLQNASFDELSLYPARSSIYDTLSNLNHTLLQDVVNTNANANETIKILNIDGVLEVQDSIQLATFLSSSAAPSKIYINNLRLQGLWTPWNNWQQASVHVLNICSWFIPTAGYFGVMLSEMAQLPNLGSLTISLCLGLEDMTEAVSTILTSQSIRYLELRNFTAKFRISNPALVLRALGQNTSIEHFGISWDPSPTDDWEMLFHIMQHENATIRALQFDSDFVSLFGAENNEKLCHYLGLNMYGRAQARAENATLEELVGLISPLTEKNFFPPRNLQFLSFTYGLLHESRTVWALPDP
jgi:hypothetical protein